MIDFTQNVEEQVRLALTPEGEFTHTAELEIVVQRIIQEVTVLKKFNESDLVVGNIVKDLYKSLESGIANYKGIMQINPKHINFLEKSSPFEEEKKRLHSRFVERLFKEELNDSYLSKGYDPDDTQVHYPHNTLAAFSVGKQVVDSQGFDLGIAIGPEGFPYGRMFELCNFHVKYIHIDEYCETEDRPYTELEPLEGIAGKDIIFLEDDVITGQTLVKAANEISRYGPNSISVYLGTPENKQNVFAVPKFFGSIHTVPSMMGDEVLWQATQDAFEVLEKKYKIFKDGESLL